MSFCSRFSPSYYLFPRPTNTPNHRVVTSYYQIGCVDSTGWMPLHLLCHKGNVDERAALEAARALIDQCPESITHATDGGFLPVHVACMSRSPEFCRLIKAYPGSARITDRDGLLPLHYACLMNNVATVEYIYKLYPDAIHNAMTAGFYPIHIAVDGVRHRSNPTTAVDIVQFLLDCDPDVKLQKVRGRLSLLHVACEREYIDSNIEAGIQVIEVIYDAYPEAIENNEISSDIRRYHQQVQTFINSQLVYSRQAKDHRLMMTPNEKGQLPLHTALHDSASLGSIMLLVKGNPSGIRIRDNNLALPLHLACQNHESAGVVEYLLGLDATTLVL